MNNQYPHPTPLDVNAFEQGITKIDECRTQIRGIINALEKHIKNLDAIRHEAKQAKEYASDICDLDEEEAAVSVESIAGFYASLKSLDVFVEHIKFNAQPIENSVSADDLDAVADKMFSALMCVTDIPLRQRQAVDNAQSSQANG